MAFVGFSDKLNEVWELWKQYRKEQHGFEYKSMITEEHALRSCYRLTTPPGDEGQMIEVIEQSIARGWAGFFQIKNPSLKQMPNYPNVNYIKKCVGSEFGDYKKHLEAQGWKYVTNSVASSFQKKGEDIVWL